MAAWLASPIAQSNTVWAPMFFVSDMRMPWLMSQPGQFPSDTGLCRINTRVHGRLAQTQTAVGNWTKFRMLSAGTLTDRVSGEYFILTRKYLEIACKYYDWYNYNPRYLWVKIIKFCWGIINNAIADTSYGGWRGEGHHRPWPLQITRRSWLRWRSS